MIPAVANIVGWAMLFSPRVGYINTLLRWMLQMDPKGTGPIDIYTTYGIIISTGLALTSFVYVFVRGGLMNINAELNDAAAVSGASPFVTIRTITVPVIRPALVYGAGVALLLGLGQFTAPLLLGVNGNVTVLSNANSPARSRAADRLRSRGPLASPLLATGIVIVIVQRSRCATARYVTHAGRSAPRPLRPSRWAVVPIVVHAVVAIVLPVGALIVVALSPFYSRDIDMAAFSLDNFRAVLDDPGLFDGIRTSVFVSVAAVLIVLVIGYLVAELLESEWLPSWFRAVLDVRHLPARRGAGACSAPASCSPPLQDPVVLTEPTPCSSSST